MFIWFSTMTLMVEATRVIELRLRLIVLRSATNDQTTFQGARHRVLF